ncbi:MAG: PDZ domain-containing protein [Deltaproteobacteria bacterium]|nr:PDZ domain-containing protein [Deltaproteobacteria bacterium]
MHAFPEEYVGVGVELTVRDGVPQVVQVVPGSPADMAGLAPGMELRTVAGEDVRGRPLADVVKLLRGKPETRVSVEAAQGGRTFRVSLLRRSLTRAGADGGGYLTGSR